MKITVETTAYRDSDDNACEIEVYLDKKGLEYLIKELECLKKPGDHVHFMTPSWGMSDLSEDKFRIENDLIHHFQVILVHEKD